MTELPKQDLLIKLMSMTASDNDSEALVAVRKANALLLSAGWTWEKLIQGRIKVIADPFHELPKKQQPSNGWRDGAAAPNRPTTPSTPPPSYPPNAPSTPPPTYNKPSWSKSSPYYKKQAPPAPPSQPRAPRQTKSRPLTPAELNKLMI